MKDEHELRIVCCKTCCNSACDIKKNVTQEYQDECLEENDLILYWSEETGYLPKLTKSSYENFIPPKNWSIVDFLTEEELLL